MEVKLSARLTVTVGSRVRARNWAPWVRVYMTTPSSARRPHCPGARLRSAAAAGERRNRGSRHRQARV